MIDGCGLFYFRPDQKLKYQIYFFNKNQYRVYHDVNGQIEEVVIIYDYKVKNATLGLPSDVYGQNKRYVVCRLQQTQFKKPSLTQSSALK